jgi:Fe(3+) dicitrate transport protein
MAGRVTEVRGRILDASGGVVAGAEVTLRLKSTGAETRKQSDAEGRFAFHDVGRGVYELEARFRGFAAARHEVQVSESAVEIDLRLVPASIRQELVVTAERVIGTPEILEHHPGSADLVPRTVLTESRVFTTDEALRKVAGVNTRGEEGFGLRPNIGIRGLNPTRSTHVLLLEDGLPLAYAPYGDNASYYHPPIDRFDDVEVIKGGGQVLYGPRTVGAVVNYITPPIPNRLAGSVSLTGGTRDYLNGHLRIGNTFGKTGWLLDYLRKQGKGARENLGHGLNDVNFKANRVLTPKQVLIARVNYYSEDSRVTYSGLRQDEFNANPRGNPFRNDSFEIDRYAASLRHTWAPSEQWLVNTAAYGTVFRRDWWRQSSNSNQRPNDAADPNCSGMQNLNTTCGNEGRLRDYYTWGVESRVRAFSSFRGMSNATELGLRFHRENQERRQENGPLPNSRAGVMVENNLRRAEAFSFFAQNSFQWQKWSVTPGVRVERIHYDRTNRLANGGAGVSGKDELTQAIPGIGVAYSPNTSFTFFAGAHRGFAPPRVEDVISNSTGATVELDPELSWNYEVGFRSRLHRSFHIDFTFFRMDFENQIVPASVAGGVGAALTNAGETLHQGFELSWNASWSQAFGSRHRLYWRGAYTWLPTARFDSTRFSNVPGFTTVSVQGNRLPYAPENLLTTSFGFVHTRGMNALIELVYTGRQFGDDLNSVIGTADGQRGLLPGNAVWNATLNYPVEHWHSTFFVSVKNLFDRLAIVDRTRGIMPSAPRLVQAGVSWNF